jgi:DNA topoisomerase-2
MKTEPQSRPSGDSSTSSGGDMLSSLLSGGGKTPREEILMQPEVYIGSVEKRTQKLWVYEGAWMKHREVTYVPGLYKIFDEVLVYAVDNKQQDPTMDHLIVEIDATQCSISVFYNGDRDGIPIDQIHSQEGGVYVSEMVFGHLSNCHPNVEEVSAGGRSSYGVKLANIFSTEFVIEIADRRRERKYKQVR